MKKVIMNCVYYQYAFFLAPFRRTCIAERKPLFQTPLTENKETHYPPLIIRTQIFVKNEQ